MRLDNYMASYTKISVNKKHKQTLQLGSTEKKRILLAKVKTFIPPPQLFFCDIMQDFNNPSPSFVAWVAL